MATDENDREDLLREAKMMPSRGETQIDEKTIVVGFRRDGQMSLYCGADPVFQFNANQELRRVFYEGERYAADSGHLVKLTRDTKGGRVTFIREAVPAKRTMEIQASLGSWLETISRVPETAWISAGDDAKFFQQVEQWIHDNDASTAISNVPNA